MCSSSFRRQLMFAAYYFSDVRMWSLLAICTTVLLILYPRSSFTYISVLGPKYPPTQGEVWPKPQYEVKENWFYTFRLSIFRVTVTNNTCDILQNAIKRYEGVWRHVYAIAKKNRGNESRTIHSNKLDKNYQGFIKLLRVDLKFPCENNPYFGMDERYELSVASVATLKSASIWGILRGLESLSQLFYFADYYQEIHINATKIHDYPQYKHRGLLLDTGRHYVSLKNILRTLEAMAMNKMNVFHWHIVDDQSFPYQSEKFPELSEKGAFHPSLVYTKKDIKMIINQARLRGIRVLPEFDVPGHTRSWGAAYPKILTECYQNHKLISLGPLNPIQNETYSILQGLLQEVQELFPDKYIHVGGDEVDLKCWQSNPELVDYMSKNNLSPKKLHAKFMQDVIPLLDNTSIPIVWQEVFDENVPLSKETLVQVWKYVWIEEMVKILSAGHRVLYSSSWYLDYLNFSWSMFYQDDPRLMVYKVKPNLNLENIVGGEACMWGEMADDSNLISRTWPRTSGVAERLWTGLDYKNPPQDLVTPYVRRRIEEHTCRMKQRGISAEPPNGPGFCVGTN